MTMSKITRRRLVGTGAGAAAVATLGAPAILHAQTATLKITTWGGKWGDIMKGEVLPAFEKEHKCTVSVDQAFPFVPKLQASPKNDPLYDVLQANTPEQWQVVEAGYGEEKVDTKRVPNLADAYGFAQGDQLAGVAIFVSAVGFGYRTDKGLTKPTSWKDLADPKLAGARGSYVIPINSIGQAHLMMLGKVYGKGFEDLDAAYKALEQLKPIKMYDFTGGMEKALLSAEVHMGVLHDSGVYRYDGQNQPIDFAAPKEGVMVLDQCLNVTSGSPRKELAYAYIDYMLRPDVQKKLAEAVWYSPANKKVQLGPEYRKRLYDTPEKVATLLQMPWRWYNARFDQINSRVTRILRG
jgi:putative spermidine/putrescine transport system substrate-binding protein